MRADFKAYLYLKMISKLMNMAFVMSRKMQAYFFFFMEVREIKTEDKTFEA